MLYEKIPLSEKNEEAYLETFVTEVSDPACDGMLIIPGGGYGGVCSDREGYPIAYAFCSRGVNCFVLHYSVNRKGVFPDQLIEASRAMKHIKENAEKYRVNPDRIFTVGFSAGGHLAGSLGTLWHLPEVQKAVGGPEGINRPAGMVLCYPVITGFEHAHKGSFYNLLCNDNPTDEEIAKVSLEKQVSDKTVPAFLMHTADDECVPVQNALIMAEALTEKKIPYEVHIYPHGPHGLALANSITDMGCNLHNNPVAAKWVDDAVCWMKRI